MRNDAKVGLSENKKREFEDKELQRKRRKEEREEERKKVRFTEPEAEVVEEGRGKSAGSSSEGVDSGREREEGVRKRKGGDLSELDPRVSGEDEEEAMNIDQVEVLVDKWVQEVRDWH